MTDDPISYRAPRWMLWGVIVALLLFSALLMAPTLNAGIPRYVGWIGGVGVLIGVGGILELVIGRVVLERDHIVIRQWYRTDRVSLAEVESVSLEGGLTALRLKTGKWRRLPEWIGANRSLGANLRARLKNRPGS